LIQLIRMNLFKNNKNQFEKYKHEIEEEEEVFVYPIHSIRINVNEFNQLLQLLT
jgi:hypothetical protein